MRDDDRLDRFKERADQAVSQRAGITISQRLAPIGDDLDTTLNFRVNSGLKAQFEKLCKQNHSSVARELKQYMRSAVHLGKLL